MDQFLRAREYSKISQFGAEYFLLCHHVECVLFCQTVEVGEHYDPPAHGPVVKQGVQALDHIRLYDKGVDQPIVCCNRVIMLHEPPGTGKTSLCKALAQKLSIRLSSRYTTTELAEINFHSPFSKWFSESGKLNMFTEIKRLMEDPRFLVCVLIDEVESLTASRMPLICYFSPLPT